MALTASLEQGVLQVSRILMCPFVLQVLDEFSKQVDRIEWPIGSPASIHYTALDGHLSRYQVGCTEASRRGCVVQQSQQPWRSWLWGNFLAALVSVSL